MKDFELLKRTYPTSRYDRPCDGYVYILKNSTRRQRKKWGIKTKELQQIIRRGEKYIYQVAKEGKEFKTISMCFENHAIIREFMFGKEDE